MSFRDYPAVGQYVLCRFPERDEPDKPGPKFRPGLIVGYGPEYGLDANVAVIAYSTTQFNANMAHALVNVRDKVVGLDMPDDPAKGPYVDCKNVRAIPIVPEYFSNFKAIARLPEETFNFVRNTIQQFRPKPFTDALYLDPVYVNHQFYDDTQVTTPYFAVEQSDPAMAHFLPQDFGQEEPLKPQSHWAWRGVEKCRDAISQLRHKLLKASCG